MPTCRILFVGETSKQELLKCWLSPLHHELVAVNTGEQALRLLGEQPPDLVLLDDWLPDRSGLDLVSEIRGRDMARRVPVILVTAGRDRAYRLRGFEAGADDLLDTPLDGPLFLARVTALLASKQASDALAASNEELGRRHTALEEVQHEQRELTAFVVHDLKNPLSVILAGLNFAHARNAKDDHELASSMSESLDAARRLSTMISDLLAISRMETVGFALEAESVLVNDLVEAVCRAYTGRASERLIRFARFGGFALEVRVDRVLLQRVLENILDNAFRYTPPEGRIAIEARPGVEIVISNDGPPIPALDRERIFGKFNRGEADSVSRSNAGLGLYFCRRALQAHGGAIDLVEHRDFPTSFRISLPAQPRAAAASILPRLWTEPPARTDRG